MTFRTRGAAGGFASSGLSGLSLQKSLLTLVGAKVKFLAAKPGTDGDFGGNVGPALRVLHQLSGRHAGSRPNGVFAPRPRPSKLRRGPGDAQPARYGPPDHADQPQDHHHLQEPDQNSHFGRPLSCRKSSCDSPATEKRREPDSFANRKAAVPDMDSRKRPSGGP